MVKKNTLLICSLAFFSLMGCKGKNELTVPVNLRTEYLREPIGLDTKSPRFTWEYKGSEKNFLLPVRKSVSGPRRITCNRIPVI